MKITKNMLVALGCSALLGFSLTGCKAGTAENISISETAMSHISSEAVFTDITPTEDIIISTTVLNADTVEITSISEESDSNVVSAVSEESDSNVVSVDNTVLFEETVAEPSAVVVEKINDAIAKILGYNESDCADMGLNFAELQEQYKADKEAFLSTVQYSIYTVKQVGIIKIEGKEYLAVSQATADVPYFDEDMASYTLYDTESGEVVVTFSVAVEKSLEEAMTFYYDSEGKLHLYTEMPDFKCMFDCPTAVIFNDWVLDNGKFVESSMGVFDSTGNSGLFFVTEDGNRTNVVGDERPVFTTDIRFESKSMNIDSWLINKDEKGTCSIIVDDNVFTAYDIAKNIY